MNCLNKITMHVCEHCLYKVLFVRFSVDWQVVHACTVLHLVLIIPTDSDLQRLTMYMHICHQHIQCAVWRSPLKYVQSAHSYWTVTRSHKLEASLYLNWIRTGLQTEVINPHPICIQCALITSTLPKYGSSFYCWLKCALNSMFTFLSEHTTCNCAFGCTVWSTLNWIKTTYGSGNPDSNRSHWMCIEQGVVWMQSMCIEFASIRIGWLV